MSTWLHCEDQPEHHLGHSWTKIHGYDADMRPQTSEHMCPGVKHTNEMHVLELRRDRIRIELKEVEERLREASVRYRRTPHQYTVNDDNAPAEDPG